MKIAIFFAFALTVATAQTTDWAALNETMLHDLNADAFNGITPAQLGSIRTDAIPGLRADQFGAIPAPSWSGLTPDQFYNLSSLICSTLSKEFFQNVAPASLQNFTVACVQVAQAGSFSGFTDQGLSNVTVESFSAFSADQVFALPEESSKSLTRSQVVALGSNADTKACVGLKASFVNNFPLDTFSDIKAACIEQFNATQIPGLAVQSVANLDAALAPVLSQDQVKALGENCAGLRPDFFSKIAFFANLTNQCVSRLPGPAFTTVTADQVKQLTVEAVNAINQAQFMNFNTDAAAGFSEAQVAAFNKDGCKGIPADFAGKLLDTSVTGLTPDCVQNANETFFAKFSAAQTTVLKLEVVKILSELQVLNFAFDATSGFTWQQINVLGYETGCKGLDSGFVGNLKVGSIDALSPDCIKNARDHAFFTLSAVQVRNLTEIAFSGFTSNQMGWFSLEAAKAVSPGQVSNLGVTTGCAGLGGEVAANFPTAVFPAISRDCLANTNATFFASLPDDSVKAITNTTIAGIQERHFEYIPARVAADFTEVQTSQFSDDACKGITAIVLGNLVPATGLKGLTSSCISNIKPFSFTLLSADQLNSLNCTVLNAEQLSFVPVATFDAISIVCIQQLTPSAFSAITPNQLEKLPTNIVALLTAAQLSQFSPLSIRNMTVAQVQALNTNATSGFTGDQLGNLTVAQGINFINALTIDRWTANPQTAMDYVAKLGVLFEGVIAFKDITNSSTWIQLANLENSTFVLDANFVSKIYPMTFMGLRPLYVPLLPEEAFKVFTKEQTAYLLPPVVSQFSGNQVKGFTPEAFGNLYPASYDALSKDALKSLTDDQIKAIPASVFKDCTFADHLQDSGRELPFTGDAKTNYDQCIAERNGGKSGLTGGQIAGIVIGSIAGAALLAGAIIYFVRRRKYSYQAI